MKVKRGCAVPNGQLKNGKIDLMESAQAVSRLAPFSSHDHTFVQPSRRPALGSAHPGRLDCHDARSKVAQMSTQRCVRQRPR
jgi:hypothetical protein